MSPKPKGLMWNHDQLKIAKLLLDDGLSPLDIAKARTYKYTTAKKVQKALESGDTPSSLEAS